MRPKILALCGSTRAASTNEKILALIASGWSDKLDITLHDSLALLPHFNPDVNDDAVPATVADLRQKISVADGVIICTPEYIFSAPGVLKNALEWMVSVTVLSDKPTALIVASGLGEKTLESLTLVLNTLGVKWTDGMRLLIQGARSKLNAAGEFDDHDGRVRAAIAELVRVIGM